MNTRSNTHGKLLNNLHLQRSLIFGAIIVTALFAFEAFNYGTTHFALTDLLGDLSFAGLSWATILAIAFCGIDFAGIARLFAPEARSERTDSWYLFGAWLLAATMNAMLTWWGVSLAILDHTSSGTAVIGRDTLLRAVPIFVAIMVWLIRILIIGTISMSGDRLFVSNGERPRNVQQPINPQGQTGTRPVNFHNLPATNSARINAAPASKAGAVTGQTAGSQNTFPAMPRTRTFSTTPVNSSTISSEVEDMADNEHSLTDPAYIPAPLAAQSSNRSRVGPVSDQRANTRYQGRKF